MSTLIKKEKWSELEDQKLRQDVLTHGARDWKSKPLRAGLRRTGESCSHRWTNYLSPDVSLCDFTDEEQLTIRTLRAQLGNKWSTIARHLPGRTAMKVKNFCNKRTHSPTAAAEDVGLMVDVPAAGVEMVEVPAAAAVEIVEGVEMVDVPAAVERVEGVEMVEVPAPAAVERVEGVEMVEFPAPAAVERVEGVKMVDVPAPAAVERVDYCNGLDDDLLSVYSNIDLENFFADPDNVVLDQQLWNSNTADHDHAEWFRV